MLRSLPRCYRGQPAPRVQHAFGTFDHFAKCPSIVGRACGVPDCPDLGPGFVRPVVRVFWSAQGGARIAVPRCSRVYIWSAQTRRLSVRVHQNQTLRSTLHHAGGLRPIESMAAAQMQQLETNVAQRRPEQQPSAAAAANVFTTAQHASLLAGMPGSVSARTLHGAFAFRFGGNLQPQH